jgi:hypothetical protein
MDKLNPERVLDLWSKTYNREGKPDWSHIFPFYHESIVFQDSIQKIVGKPEFLEMCNRLTTRCQSLHMELLNVVQKDNVIFMEWIMTMSFKKSPSTPLFGSTRLTLNDEGYIIEQRDYYDLWGDIFNNIPHFNRIYRRFLKKHFG